MAKVAELHAYDEDELQFWIDTFTELTNKSRDTAYAEVLQALIRYREELEIDEEDRWDDD